MGIMVFFVGWRHALQSDGLLLLLLSTYHGTRHLRTLPNPGQNPRGLFYGVCIV